MVVPAWSGEACVRTGRLGILAGKSLRATLGTASSPEEQTNVLYEFSDEVDDNLSSSMKIIPPGRCLALRGNDCELRWGFAKMCEHVSGACRCGLGGDRKNRDSSWGLRPCR